jgi:hypothetical protein
VKQWKAHKALCEVISQNRNDDEVKNEEYKKTQVAQLSKDKKPLIQEI